MRISDWSSDVCSSDLFGVPIHHRVTIEAPSLSAGPSGFVVGALVCMLVAYGAGFRVVIDHMIGTIVGPEVMFQRGIGMNRSEERRVGKECGSTGRSRCVPCNTKKKKTI